MKDQYTIMGHFYDFGCYLISGKSIQCCRVSNLIHLKAGDKVLFAGVGHGRDALFAAQLGADVTVVDLSETMLRKFSKILKSERVKTNIRQIHGDIMQFNEIEKYDMVVANFFLNLFKHDMMIKILDHIIKQGKPGAQIVVSDFAFPTGNTLSRMFKKMYWYFVVLLFWFFAGNSVHEIYNYPEIMKNLGLQIKSTKYTRLLKIRLFWSILGEK